MFRFRERSIKKKLVWMSVVASGSALLVACGAFLLYEGMTFRAALVRSLSTQAELVGLNAASALLFNDPSAANETLSTLSGRQEIISAGLYTREGQPFAAYYRDGQSRSLSLPDLPPGATVAHRFAGRRLVVVRPVVFKGETIGRVHIESDMKEMDERIKGYAGIVVLALSLSFGVALFISSRLQNSISQPILRLTETAAVVSRDKNYSVRAAPGSRDEIGLLISAFNEMLDQIQQRGAALQEAQDDLEKRIRERTAELEAANKELDRFFTLSLDLICIAGFDGYFKRLNPVWETVLGFSREELLAAPYLDFVHPDDRAATQAEADKVNAGGTVISFENRYRCKDGSYRWLLWKAVPVLDQKLVYAAARDITERKYAQQALQESEERHRRLFENSPQPMWVFDVETLAFLAVNDATVLHYGYTREELLAMTVRDIRPPEDVPRFLQHLSSYSAQPTTVTTWRHRKKDGSLIDVEVHAQRLRFGGRAASLVLVYDVTERNEVHARLQRINTELEATNKELETFTYSVSHDLRAPLRHVAGFSRILLEDHTAQLNPDAQHCVARVQQGVEQMGLLVDDLLNLSRVSRQELRRQITGLTPLVEQTVQQLSADTQGRQVEWRVQPLPFVDCDPALMKQVFANLLSNAVKFTRTRSPAVIEVGADNRNGEPVLFVRDNGVGFPMKYAGKLFGVFQRLHRQEDFEGTGVGLAIVHRILAKHGGRIWAEGELDKGATFFFTLGAPESLESSAEVNPEWTPVK